MHIRLPIIQNRLHVTDYNLFCYEAELLGVNQQVDEESGYRTSMRPPWYIALATTVPTVGRPTVIKIRKPASASDSVPAAL